MKLTIKANNTINNVKIKKDGNNEIKAIIIDFEKSYNWSDLEIWLNSQDDKFLDYMKIYISNRDKMRACKG